MLPTALETNGAWCFGMRCWKGAHLHGPLTFERHVIVMLGFVALVLWTLRCASCFQSFWNLSLYPGLFYVSETLSLCPFRLRPLKLQVVF